VNRVRVHLYEDRRGRSGVRDFLNRLGVSDRAKIENKLNMIGLLGWNDSVSAGLLKNFGGNIYEVVVKGTPYRVLGFRPGTGSRQSLILVEGFKKSIWKPKQKKQILERAERLRGDWFERHKQGGDS
jgi:hypothetical protein